MERNSQGKKPVYIQRGSLKYSAKCSSVQTFEETTQGIEKNHLKTLQVILLGTHISHTEE